MKPYLIVLSALVLVLPACKEKGPGEKFGEKVDDALDQRPAEKVQDTGENLKDAVKDATN